MGFGAQTEYGRLRKVLMDRPTEELKLITPRAPHPERPRKKA